MGPASGPGQFPQPGPWAKAIPIAAVRTARSSISPAAQPPQNIAIPLDPDLIFPNGETTQRLAFNFDRGWVGVKTAFRLKLHRDSIDGPVVWDSTCWPQGFGIGYYIDNPGGTVDITPDDSLFLEVIGPCEDIWGCGPDQVLLSWRFGIGCGPGRSVCTTQLDLGNGRTFPDIDPATAPYRMWVSGDLVWDGCSTCRPYEIPGGVILPYVDQFRAGVFQANSDGPVKVSITNGDNSGLVYWIKPYVNGSAVAFDEAFARLDFASTGTGAGQTLWDRHTCGRGHPDLWNLELTRPIRPSLFSPG